MQRRLRTSYLRARTWVKGAAGTDLEPSEPGAAWAAWAPVVSLCCFCPQGKGGGQVDRAFVDKFGFDVVTCCGYLPQVSGTSAGLPPTACQVGRWGPDKPGLYGT